MSYEVFIRLYVLRDDSIDASYITYYFYAFYMGDDRVFSLDTMGILICRDSYDEYITESFCIFEYIQMSHMEEIEYSCSISDDFLVHIIFLIFEGAERVISYEYSYLSIYSRVLQ